MKAYTNYINKSLERNPKVESIKVEGKIKKIVLKRVDK